METKTFATKMFAFVALIWSGMLFIISVLVWCMKDAKVDNESVHTLFVISNLLCMTLAAILSQKE